MAKAPGDRLWERLGPVGRIVLVLVLSALIFAVSYVLKAQFGISLSRYSSGNGEPAGFEWAGFLRYTGLGALVGLGVGLWNQVRRRRKD